MKVSVEISYYPLKEEFKAPVKAFIADLKKEDKITVKPNSMSTHVFGEYEDVMYALTRCIKEAFELPNSIFTLKIMNLDRDK
ncbi:thiamine-binding protein [Parabacteroides sp. Marseille-P3160]|uniref:thiamine-binding protein n=1 Tax=Parabacteroides sp. Marseille-P3160 TaxID=1917887 RepID=UPI0009BA0BB1|nr:thiamine-binding protein [Parabacteroides sp. Marseille-P3160]